MNYDPKQRDQLIEGLAQRIVRCGLEVPAIFFLELNKPLAFITGQAGLVLAPTIAPFFGIDRVNGWAEIMSERENVERLIQRIEDLADDGRPGSKPRQSPVAALLNPMPAADPPKEN